MGVSVFIITFNEEKRIGRTLESLAWSDEQIVVDSGSTDKTSDIAQRMGAKVFRRNFDNFENQKNYALSLTANDWVLSIDADEIVTTLLAEEIQTALRNPSTTNGYYIKRNNYFLGKPLRFGGQGNEQVLRLFKKSRGKFSGVVHEKIILEGSVKKFKYALEHISIESLDDYYQKLNLYTDLEAVRIVQEKRTPSMIKAIFFPLGKWFLNYVLKAGFLDGWRGLVYHGLSCYYGWIKNFKARSLSQVQNENRN